MNFGLAKQIFKELRVLSKHEPNIAQTLKQNLKIHLQEYYSNVHLLKKKVKKMQKDDQLPKAFLKTLQEANTPNSFTSFKTRIKLVQMYTDISPYIDKEGFLRKGKYSVQMGFLENYKPFIAMKSEKDKQFVRKVLKRIFLGQQKYDYKNLTQFYSATRYESPLQLGSQAMNLLSSQMRTYVVETLRGETEGVSEQYVKVYKYMFTSIEKSNYQTVMDSYYKSRYILLDFEDTQIRK